MKLEIIRKYKKKPAKGFDLKMIRKNQAIWLGVSLPFIIAASISLKNAVAMTLEFFTINFFTAIVAVLIVDRAPYWVRSIINVAAATIVMVFSRAVITRMIPDISNFLGSYIYLMALNGIMLLNLEDDTESHRGLKLWPVMKIVMSHAAAFAGFILLMALPREYFGNGTLWGYPVSHMFKFSGMLIPFFGFIWAAFLIAAIRFISKKADRISASEFERRDAVEKAQYTAIHINSLDLDI